MQPIDERKQWNITSSMSGKVKKISITEEVNNFDDLDILSIKPILNIKFKRKNIMKHLTPKKKKRK